MKTNAYIIRCIVATILILVTGCEKQDNSPESHLLNNGEHFIEIDGVKLHYIVRGKGPVMIHYSSAPGWSGDVSIYYNYLSRWEEERTMVYFEPRGTGKSEKAGNIQEYKMQKFLTELEIFCDTLNLTTFDISGHCYGGILSMYYAFTHPERINKMILISSAARMTNSGFNSWFCSRPGYKNFKQVIDSLKDNNVQGNEHTKAYMLAWVPCTLEEFEKHKEKLIPILDNIIYSNEASRYFQTKEKLTYDFRDQIKYISAKTLVIRGDHDMPPIVRGSDYLGSNIPDAEYKIIPTSAHWCFISRPEAFIDETLRFLRK